MKRRKATTKGYGRRKGLLWLAVLLVALVWAAEGSAQTALRIGNPLPSAILPGLTGVPVRIPESVKGSVVLLHFWQVGCSSCKQEMPAIEELYGKYRRKGLEVLAVNIGQSRETVRAFAAEAGVSYPILIDPGRKSAALFGVTDVPRTYLLDRGGAIRYRIMGGATPEMLKKLVLSLL